MHPAEWATRWRHKASPLLPSIRALGAAGALPIPSHPAGETGVCTQELGVSVGAGPPRMGLLHLPGRWVEDGLVLQFPGHPMSPAGLALGWERLWPQVRWSRGMNRVPHPAWSGRG